MHTSVAQRAEVRALLDGKSTAQVRELCIRALREWRAVHGTAVQFSMHGDLGLRLLNLLLQEGRVLGVSNLNVLTQVFLEANDEPWMLGVVEFTRWFVRAGFAFPLQSGSPQYPYPINYRVLPAGLAFLERTDDHPLLPGAAERMRSRCPGLTDGIVALLVDARMCQEHALFRPAVVVLGVAFESAVKEVVASLVTRGHLAADILDRSAAARVTAIRGILLALLPGNPNLDQRTSVEQALTFADQLRRRRNDAAHTTPRFGFDDHVEIEELLASAGRHLPALWTIYA